MEGHMMAKKRGNTLRYIYEYAVESRFGPKRGFGETPGELLTISKPSHYPKFVHPPARKRCTQPNL